MTMKLRIVFLVAVAMSMTCKAKVEMSPLFSDNMVLQQQSEAPVWGKAKAGKKVVVTTSWDGKKYECRAEADGRWRVDVSTPKAGGPFEITVSDGKPVTLRDVMIGEVWLCSGQSNMDMPLAGWGQINDYKREIASADHPNIRLLHVANKMSARPLDDFEAVGGGWQKCSPATIAEFSSTAYFFGRALQASEDVAIGLIQSSWGGTPAEAWTSMEALEQMPDYVVPVERIRTLASPETNLDEFHANEMKLWKHKVDLADDMVDGTVVRCACADFDDSGWIECQQPGYLNGPLFDNFDGMLWLRKVVTIPREWVGNQLTLNLGCVDDSEETYVNGVLVGSTYGLDKYQLERTYSIPAGAITDTTLVITVRDYDWYGWLGITGYADSSKNINISAADGSKVDVSGKWRAYLSLERNSLPEMPREITDSKNACMLFNAMINPLVPFAIRGAIWYQGEDNANRAWQYRDLMKVLITDWRSRWNCNFPFYLAQLANYYPVQEQPGESKWAELREAQADALHLENTGMACLIDIGTADDIHPKDKQTTGLRLALPALALTYGRNVAYSGPVYSGYTIRGSEVAISFSHVDGGLTSADGNPLRGFAVAGLDHRFHWAEARIKDGKVVVSCPEVTHPVAVRYNWADNPQGNLTDESHLPAVPFRTDDWPGITYKNTVY